MARPRPVVPGPGQESVWDYPRPPRLERSEASIRVVLKGIVIVDTARSWRVFLDGERVVPQPGDFYGGWITSRVTGPFKGDPETRGW